MQSLSNRILIGGKNYKSYKNLSKFYNNYLRSNFKKTHFSFKYNCKFKLLDSSFFTNTYRQYVGMNDFNRVLLWRVLQIQSMFKILISAHKYKKQIFYRNRLQFIEEKKRILVTWNWLKFFIKSYTPQDQLPVGLENFLVRTPENHALTDIKYHVYKLQLLRSL